MGKQNATPTGPLLETDILEALQHSGFPLEIRLMEAFHEAGFDPQIGHRFIPGDGEKSAEVDVMAHASAPLANYSGIVHLKAMIEAKQLDERTAFVGLKWRQPEAHEKRSMRIRLSGRPTCQILREGAVNEDIVQIMLGPPDPIAEALDPLNEPVVCRHWTDVKDHEKFTFMARQEDVHKESFSKLIRVVTWLEEDTTAFFARTPGNPPMLRVQLLSPTIVLGTPHLYVYDPLAKTLEKTSSLIVQQMYEAGGKVHARYVDVVAEGSLPDLIDRYRRAVAGLQAACNKHLPKLKEIAEKQYDTLAISDLEEERRQFDRPI